MAKNKHRRPSHPGSTPAPAKVEQIVDQLSKIEDAGVTTAPAGDQSDTPATTSGDQNDVKARPKTKKKISPTVVGWRERKKSELNPEAIIHFAGDYGKATPKRGDAKRRFELYRDGMTVKRYLEVCKEANIRQALSKDDIHWDIEKGFITLAE